MINQTEESVMDHFFAPVHKAIEETETGKRKCPAFSDKEHILSGIGRVIGSERSGRGWVQHLQMHLGSTLSVVKKEHDMHMLKRLSAKTLRMGEKEGVKVIVAYDAAVIDYRLWRNWKTQGLYVVSIEKENSAAATIGELAWDRYDPRNTGVLSDEHVSTSTGYMMRRIRYRDPETGRDFSFMTSEFTLPPGLIAFIYKLRWDIEKAFDEKKNKLGVVKTWAVSPEARCQQAHFFCLAHNLMLMLERRIDKTEGLRDEKVEAKRAARLVLAERAAEEAGRKPNPLVAGCARATERSLQFIRWLRHCLKNPRHWSLEIEVLRPYMKTYIS